MANPHNTTNEKTLGALILRDITKEYQEDVDGNPPSTLTGAQVVYRNMKTKNFRDYNNAVTTNVSPIEGWAFVSDGRQAKWLTHAVVARDAFDFGYEPSPLTTENKLNVLDKYKRFNVQGKEVKEYKANIHHMYFKPEQIQLIPGKQEFNITGPSLATQTGLVSLSDGAYQSFLTKDDNYGIGSMRNIMRNVEKRIPGSIVENQGVDNRLPVLEFGHSPDHGGNGLCSFASDDVAEIKVAALSSDGIYDGFVTFGNGCTKHKKAGAYQAAHISTKGNFFMNGGKDGPLKFEEQFKAGSDAPILRKVHLGFNGGEWELWSSESVETPEETDDPDSPKTPNPEPKKKKKPGSTSEPKKPVIKGGGGAGPGHVDNPRGWVPGGGNPGASTGGAKDNVRKRGNNPLPQRKRGIPPRKVIGKPTIPTNPWTGPVTAGGGVGNVWGPVAPGQNPLKEPTLEPGSWNRNEPASDDMPSKSWEDLANIGAAPWQQDGGTKVELGNGLLPGQADKSWADQLVEWATDKNNPNAASNAKAPSAKGESHGKVVAGQVPSTGTWYPFNDLFDPCRPLGGFKDAELSDKARASGYSALKLTSGPYKGGYALSLGKKVMIFATEAEMLAWLAKRNLADIASHQALSTQQFANHSLTGLVNRNDGDDYANHYTGRSKSPSVVSFFNSDMPKRLTQGMETRGASPEAIRDLRNIYTADLINDDTHTVTNKWRDRYINTGARLNPRKFGRTSGQTATSSLEITASFPYDVGTGTNPDYSGVNESDIINYYTNTSGKDKKRLADFQSPVVGTIMGLENNETDRAYGKEYDELMSSGTMFIAPADSTPWNPFGTLQSTLNFTLHKDKTSFCFGIGTETPEVTIHAAETTGFYVAGGYNLVISPTNSTIFNIPNATIPGVAPVGLEPEEMWWDTDGSMRKKL